MGANTRSGQICLCDVPHIQRIRIVNYPEYSSGLGSRGILEQITSGILVTNQSLIFDKVSKVIVE